MQYSANYIGTIGIMSGIHSLPTPFVKSLTQMLDYTYNYVLAPGERIKTLFSDRSYHANARNQLAWDTHGEWILMLDTDHTFDPDLLARMLHTMKKINAPVLTGVYVKRDIHNSPELYLFNEKTGWLDIIGKWDNTNPFRLHAAGGGCMMIKAELFQKIREQYKCQPFDIMHPYSEDISFFLRLYKMKVDVWCNPLIDSQHLTWKTISYKDFKPEGVFIKDEVEVEGRTLI